MTINANTLSNDVNLILPLFYDACDSSEGLTNYANSIPLRNNGACSLSFDSTNQNYILTNTVNASDSFMEIIPLQGVTTNFKFTMTSKSASGESGSLYYYIDDNNWGGLKIDMSTNLWVSNKVNGVFRETKYTTSNPVGSLHTCEYTVDTTNNIMQIDFYNESKVLVASKTLALPTLPSTVKWGMTMTWLLNNSQEIYEIKVEQL